jgi:predicted DNA-binding protein (MmcQ/YjbR family)
MTSMNADKVRTLLLGLPHVVETEQWGGLVFWVGDKAVGGKMFVMLPLDGIGPPISYPAGQERYDELVEREDIKPAPYMARIWWVAPERWDAFSDRQWEQELRAAHAMTQAKLPAKVQATLALPKSELKRVVAEKRKALEAKAAAKKTSAKKKKSSSPMSVGFD